MTRRELLRLKNAPLAAKKRAFIAIKRASNAKITTSATKTEGKNYVFEYSAKTLLQVFVIIS